MTTSNKTLPVKESPLTDLQSIDLKRMAEECADKINSASNRKADGFYTGEIILKTLEAAVKEVERHLAYKNDTANTFMNQVKKLQAELAEARKDSSRLDWLEKHSSYCREQQLQGNQFFTPVRGTVRLAIDAALNNSK